MSDHLIWPRGGSWSTVCHWPREYLHCTRAGCVSWVPMPGANSSEDDIDAAIVLHGWSRDRWGLVVCPEHA